MLQYGIKQPLRFYQKLEHQNRYRKGADIKVFKLLMPATRLLPFQIKREAGLLPISSIKYVPTNGGAAIEVLSELAAGEVKTYPFQNYDYLVHFGLENHGATIPAGEYYLEVTDSVSTWYSETVEVSDFNPDDLTANTCAVTKITYFDTCDVAGIFYRTQAYGGPQYKNVLYLDIDIGKPEYDYNEEGDEDGEGVFEADYQKLEKSYLLQGVYPEYLVDALTLIPLHIGKTGVVEVLTDRGYTGAVDRITVDPKWQGERGLWALTDILFSTEFTVKSNCCDALEVPLTSCLRNSTPVVAALTDGSVDYLAFQYSDARDVANKIALVDGDRVLVTVSGGTELRTYEEVLGQYTLVASTVGQAVQDENIARYANTLPVPVAPVSADGTLFEDRYHFYKAGQPLYGNTPVIFTEGLDAETGRRRLTGTTWEDSVVNVYVVTTEGEELVASVLGSEFNDTGVVYSIVAFATGVYFTSSGLTCELGQSAVYEYPFGGVGVGAVGSTFAVG